jgi:hypothetical protein
MIIRNFNIVYASAFEPKAYSPLIDYPDAPLSGPIALQGFEPVAGRKGNIVHLGSNVQHRQLSHSRGLDAQKSFDAFALNESFRIPAFKGYDHGMILS